MSYITPDVEAVFSVEAEQQVLGAILIDNERYEAVAGKVKAETFGDPVHAALYEAIEQRINAGQTASPVTLSAAFKNDAGLAELGGTKYLAKLAAFSVSPKQIGEYAQIVCDLAAKRDLIDAMTEAREAIKAGKLGAPDIAAKIETVAGAVTHKTNSKPLIRSHVNSITTALSKINDAYMGVSPPGISTGIPQLDNKIGFMRAGDLILIAGRPSMGKTTVGQNIAYAAACGGVGAFYGSLEMSGDQLGTRWLSRGLSEQGLKVPYSRMIRGSLNETEMRAVAAETQKQASLPMFTGERDVREIGRLRLAVKRAQQQLAETDTPLGLVVIDYVQQLHAEGTKSIYERVSQASDMCKSIAIEFNLPVVALSQLSREVERRDPPIPTMADLRESGKLEEDADVVMFCFRDEYYLQKKLDAMNGSDLGLEADLRAALSRCENQLDLIIAKQRSGATGTVRAFMDPACCHVYADQSHTDERLI